MKNQRILLLSAMLVACSNQDEEDISSSAQELEQDNAGTALYAIDGTDTAEKNRSTMFRLAHSVSGEGLMRYTAGVNGGIIFDRSDIARREWLSRAVCDDIAAGVKRIGLAGYSRGAILVLAGIGEAQDLCPELDPMGKVVWVGLLDAVDTRIQWQMDLYTKHPALKSVNIHVHKEHTWEHFVTTKMIPGFVNSPIAVGGHQELSGAYYYAGEDKPNVQVCTGSFLFWCMQWRDTGVRNGAPETVSDDAYGRLRDSAMSAGINMKRLPQRVFD
jgi:hypothetical protein